MSAKFSHRGMDVGVVSITQKPDGTFSAKVEVAMDHDFLADRITAAQQLQACLRRARPRNVFTGFRKRAVDRLQATLVLQACARRAMLLPLMRLAMRRKRQQRMLGGARRLQAGVRRLIVLPRMQLLRVSALCLQCAIRRTLTPPARPKTLAELQEEAAAFILPYLLRTGRRSIRKRACYGLVRFVKAVAARQGVHRLVVLLRRARTRTTESPMATPEPDQSALAKAQQHYQQQQQLRQQMQQQLQMRRVQQQVQEESRASLAEQQLMELKERRGSASPRTMFQQQGSPNSQQSSPPYHHRSPVGSEMLSSPTPYQPYFGSPTQSSATNGNGYLSSSTGLVMPIRPSAAGWEMLGSMSQPRGGQPLSSGNVLSPTSPAPANSSKIKPSFQRTNTTTSNSNNNTMESYPGIGGRTSPSNTKQIASYASPSPVDGMVMSVLSPTGGSNVQTKLTPKTRVMTRAEREGQLTQNLSVMESSDTVVLQPDVDSGTGVVRAVGGDGKGVLNKRVVRPKGSVRE